MNSERGHGRARLAKLQKNIHRVEPLLYKDEWVIEETPIDDINGAFSRWLKSTGAIEKVRTERIEAGHKRCVWRWDENIQQELQDYFQNLNRFSDYLKHGCECRAHIPSSVDPYVCEYCGKEYTREDIEQIQL